MADKVGAVMVVGGGIAGIQSSIDLAESGYYVYMVETSPAIGGVMAQLDKTFPTNDCSMCVISPKLAEVGGNLNINILTATDVESISGEPGNFKVKLHKHARFVDLAKCTGCGDCAAACPITRPNEFNAALNDRKAVYKRYPQAIPNAFSIEKLGEAPCRNACPIEQRAMGYVALIREKRFADAYRTIKEDNPFPSVCGRVCNHRCEEACSRGENGHEAVNIMHLKRFVTDWAFAHPEDVKKAYASGRQIEPDQSGLGKKVAIIGSGPAGMTAANDLIAKNYEVTVFEALSVPGGMMRVGIPEYRMPYDLVQKEIDEITARGVTLKLNQRVDDAASLLSDFDAVFIATGAHTGIKLPIPGNDLKDVHLATDFLREVSTNGASGTPSPFAGKRILVLGGGNVAIDAAMSSVRLGASWVGMSCLESEEKMPAHDWEVRDAREEGIAVYPGRTFKEITNQNGKITGVRTVNVNFRGFVNGRPDFDEIAGSEEVVPCDIVIFAVGQKPDLGLLKEKVNAVNGRTVAVDKTTLATNVPGVFAGGDAVTGTTFVVDAIEAGHRAAKAIESYLAKQEGRAWPPVVETVEKLPEAALDAGQKALLIEEKSQASRFEPPKRGAAERKKDFLEVEAALTEDDVVEAAKRCLECGICSECNQCMYACRAGAINHDDRDQHVEINVGAVLLTPGFKTVDGNIRPEFGYGVYPNVVTSLEFERILSASGPYAGTVQRRSDGSHPRKIAWIQCVGSRDTNCGNEYCSSVCCMYATKEAVIAKEHDGNIEPTIFYMDIRAFGKNFESYYQRAKEGGVRYIKSMVSKVREDINTHNLLITYIDEEGKVVEEEFDMVVLSVGLEPAGNTVDMVKRLGVELDKYGFAKTDPFEPAATMKPGVYVCGAYQGPKDIPETVAQASGAVADTTALLADARGTLIRKKEYPQEINVEAQDARIGVFVCNCGINIGGVVNVPAVRDYARTLDNVVHVEDNLFTCSQDTQSKIIDAIKEHKLNRVIVASCSPRTHEPMFRETVRQAGLNKYLFEMANIRDQCSWVHMKQKSEATEKAMDLVRMAVANARLIRPLEEVGLPVTHKAIVIGGGIAGMTSALKIADQGYEVFLIEKEDKLGGNIRNLHYTLEGKDIPALLGSTTERVANHPLIHTMLNSELLESGGSKGNFTSKVRVGKNGDGEIQEIKHGVTVIATGAREWKPNEYLYGEDPRIMTQIELENRIVSRPADIAGAKKIVMIQCVGSRNEERPGCSRTCCATAVKNALKIKELNPEADITVLYRDVRTYGLAEPYYAKAREQGVLFVRYEPELKPEVANNGHGLTVSYLDKIVREQMSVSPDFVILSSATVPRENEDVAKRLKLPRNAEGFFIEAHMKLRPVDFASDGIFLAGTAHSPKLITETLTQASAAAARACTILSKEKVMVGGIVAMVDGERCAACLTCVRSCPFEVPVINIKGEAEIDLTKCKGCGTCVGECPAKAIELMHFRDPQLWEKAKALVIGSV
jgi:heterodisulfide reductase subunit A-like polyferredoxin